MPEARCRSRTALSVLLTCCPPGPLERNVSTSHSRNSSSSDSGNLITGFHYVRYALEPLARSTLPMNIVVRESRMVCFGLFRVNSWIVCPAENTIHEATRNYTEFQIEEV